MECAAQITGGYFADPGYKDVPNLAYVGFPIAEVAADGSAVITKLADAGGLVSERTVKEQLLYEVHDPAAYVTPDVVADFSRVQIGEEARTGSRSAAPHGAAAAGAAQGHGRVRRRPARRGRRSPTPGPGAAARAELAGAIVEERMLGLHGCNAPLRLDLIGVNALHATRAPATRATPRTCACARRCAPAAREQAELLLWEVEVAALLRPGRRRRLSRPDHALGDHPQRLSRPRAGAAPHRDHRDMTRRVPLREIAHARAGDKGDRSNVGGVRLRPRATMPRSRRSSRPSG